MGNKKIINAIERLKSLGKFQVYHATWTDDYPSFQLSHFCCSLEIDRSIIKGYGIDQDTEIAFHKSISEIVERLVFIQSSAITSNGFAAHSIPEKCLRNAQLELFERDAFFCHYYSRTPFLLKIDISHPAHGLICELASRIKMEVVVGVSQPFVGVWVCCLALVGKEESKFGFSVSLGCSMESEEQAVEKATLEALSMTPNLVYSDLKEEFPKGIEIPKNLEEHGLWALDKKNSEVIRKNLKFSQRRLQTPLVDKPQITSGLLRNEFEKFGIFVARANGDIQDLVVGPTPFDLLNVDRISKFLNRPLESREYSTIIHPLA